ncbi:MAG: transcription termination/antitermination protein NusA [Lachnospiraceae bacterium]|nr:transcription termination/antitermination protein NusA [Lachnospiraceae bacterium]
MSTDNTAAELKLALDMLEKEKEISRDVLFDAIEGSLLKACANHFGKSDNFKVEMDRETCEYHVYLQKEVVMEVSDPATQISKAEAKEDNPKVKVGDIVDIEVQSKEFGRIAAQNAKSYILQMIREKERDAIYSQYVGKQRSVVSGIVQRRVGENLTINLGKTDAILNENEQVKSENLRPNDRVKVYVLEVKKTEKGSARILVSRTHKDLVKCLFESEVAEIQDGTVEIKAIVREPGSRSKIAVWSNNPDVDAVGACVGVNSSRVNSVVDELRGEKVDIVNWDENPGRMIENALSPARIVAVFADPETNIAKVVVPDDQLSLAIGLKGQNARLAAKLTNYKIDIKDETQAKDAPGFRYEDYMFDDDEEEYDEEYEGEYAEDGEYDEEYVDEAVADAEEADAADPDDADGEE